MDKVTMASIGDKIDATIDTHGWIVMTVFPTDADGCWFSYTAGLAAKGLPEIILTGLPGEAAQPIINGLAQRMVDGEALPTDTPLERILANAYKPILKEIPRGRADEFMIQTKVRYPRYTALQLFWPDASGRLPWDEGVSPVFRKQQVDLTSAH